MTIQMDTAMNQVQQLNGDLHTGHMPSSCMTLSQVIRTFTSTTLDRIETEPWATCHCVCLIKTRRMICNMTYLGHLLGQVILPDLRSNFHINLSWSKFTCFDASWKRNTMVFRVFLYLSYFRRYSPKTWSSQKSNIFCLICPGNVIVT